MVHCGSAFEPGASGLPYYCTSICVRSWRNWRASLWIPKQKIKKNPGSTETPPLPLMMFPVLDPDCDYTPLRAQQKNMYTYIWKKNLPSLVTKHYSHFNLPGRPSSALRHWEVVEYSEVADSVHAGTWSNKKTADMDGLRYSPDDPYYRSGPVHTWLDVRVRETGDWDLFLGPLEWARAETGGADQWV